MEDFTQLDNSESIFRAKDSNNQWKIEITHAILRVLSVYSLFSLH